MPSFFLHRACVICNMDNVRTSGMKTYNKRGIGNLCSVKESTFYSKTIFKEIHKLHPDKRYQIRCIDIYIDDMRKLMHAFKRLGLYMKDRRVIENLYISLKIRVRRHGEYSEPGRLGSGVKQSPHSTVAL